MDELLDEHTKTKLMKTLIHYLYAYSIFYLIWPVLNSKFSRIDWSFNIAIFYFSLHNRSEDPEIV
jgi:hypothetical protein